MAPKKMRARKKAAQKPRARARAAPPEAARALDPRADIAFPSPLAAPALAEAADRQFRILVQGVIDYAIFMLDPGGHITTWNAGAERIKGYAPQEVIGRHFSMFYTPEDRDAGLPQRLLAQAARDGKVETEGWRLRRDGSRFWGMIVIDAIRDEEGRLIGFAKVTRDMTERLVAAEALRQSEERFRLLVQGVTDYAIYMLDPEGKITNWNVGGERIKGYAPEEVVGRHFSMFYTEEDLRAGLPQRALETAAREGRFEGEGWRVRKDGSRFFANVVVDAIRDAEGKLLGFAKITRDITQRKKAEERLEQTRAAFIQAQKMEALGQLTGGVAHDFNNLLTVILSNIELAGAPGVDERDSARLLDSARRAAGRGAMLTRQLLAFARRHPLSPKRQRVNALLQAFEAVLRRACGETCAMTLALTAEPTFAELDEAQFEAAILNLVMNARDAMPAGGNVRIRTEIAAVDAAKADALEGLRPGRYIALSVEDDGSGIPKNVLAHVFEPFFTTKEPGKGSGLGLSQVFGFAKQSGGHVTIESALGEGTTVTLYLPALEIGLMAQEEPEIGAAQARRRRRGTALIVEDDPDVLESAVVSLRSLGYEVLTAENGPGALDVLRRPQKIDLLFSDVVMPKGMTGIELAREARKLRPEVKVLLVSGYPRSVLEANEPLGDFVLIAKPYRLEELLQGLRRAAAAI
jgi:PAS domain S-box-containing protein